MKKMICLLLLLSLMVFAAGAEGNDPVEIHTAGDLLAMAENPGGNYILMEDIDMSGVEWTALDFSGTFDGNGKALLNLSVTASGAESGNGCTSGQHQYPARFYGFFGTLENAEIRDLKLVNVRTVVTSEEPAYLGGIAGRTLGTTAITGCSVTGSLELRAHSELMGIGGLVGYGIGTIRDCRADVTLISVDTDSANRGELYMGGLYGAGFIDTYDSAVKLDGYITEPGYIRAGGLIGMYMRYPLADWHMGEVTGCRAEGKITYVKSNLSYPYVKGEAAEVRNTNNYRMQGNDAAAFLRDEHTDYPFGTEMRPEMCTSPRYSERTVEGNCPEYGYTEYVCDSCGYTYTDCYTLPIHNPGQWTTVTPATEQAEGVRESVCQDCGMTFTEAIPIPEPTEPAETEPETESVKAPAGSVLKDSSHPEMLLLSILCLTMAAVSLIAAMVLGRKK